MLAMKTRASRKRRKRPSNEASQLGEEAGSEAGGPKRHKIHPKSESCVADTANVDEDSLSSPAQCPPLSGYDLDRLNYHVDLEDFGKGLQNAANAVFSSDRRSRYTQVSALLLSWEDEDPQLPVSLEIDALKDVLVNLYGFEVEEWKIPAHDSHMELNLKILQFLKDSSTKHLKVVYYAGHGKLSNHGQAIWTSHRNSVGNGGRYPTVKWSGIQNALEESHSDVLILLDCCASGVSNTDEGNGVTELIAACAFNNTANGVGPFSFTHALISQLRKLIHMPSFTVGYLYNLLFTEIQSLRIDDIQRKKAPVHLVLTQDHRLPRSITISAKRPRIPSSLGPPGGSDGLSVSPTPQPGSSSESPDPSEGNISPFSSSEASSATSTSELPEYPRLLFSIRISEDIKPNQLSTELFADWLATLPIDTKSVRIEAGFASDSTLLMVSLPVAMLGYLPGDPAITMLGVIRSTNLLTLKEGNPSAVKSSVASPRNQKGEVSDISVDNDGLTEQFHTWGRTPLDEDEPVSNVVHGKKCGECFRTDAFCQRGSRPGMCIRCQSHGLDCSASIFPTQQSGRSELYMRLGDTISAQRSKASYQRQTSDGVDYQSPAAPNSSEESGQGGCSACQRLKIKCTGGSPCLRYHQTNIYYPWYANDRDSSLFQKVDEAFLRQHLPVYAIIRTRNRRKSKNTKRDLVFKQQFQH